MHRSTRVHGASRGTPRRQPAEGSRAPGGKLPRPGRRPPGPGPEPGPEPGPGPARGCGRARTPERSPHPQLGPSEPPARPPVRREPGGAARPPGPRGRSQGRRAGRRSGPRCPRSAALTQLKAAAVPPGGRRPRAHSPAEVIMAARSTRAPARSPSRSRRVFCQIRAPRAPPAPPCLPVRDSVSRLLRPPARRSPGPRPPRGCPPPPPPPGAPSPPARAFSAPPAREQKHTGDP